MKMSHPEVIITRTPHAAGELIRELTGALARDDIEPAIYCVPVKEAELSALSPGLGRRCRALAEGSYHWVSFTSKNGVRSFARLWKHTLPNIPLSRLNDVVQVAAVGTATATELEKHEIFCDMTPSVQDARHMIAEWPQNTAQNTAQEKRVLCVQGDNARPTLSRGLEELGYTVEIAITYRMVDFPAQQPLSPREDDRARDSLKPWSLQEYMAHLWDMNQSGPSSAESNGEIPRVLIATSPLLLTTFVSAWRTMGKETGTTLSLPQIVAIGSSTEAQAHRLGLLSTRVAATPAPADLARETARILTNPTLLRS